MGSHLAEAWPGSKAPGVEALPDRVAYEQLAAADSLAAVPVAIGGNELESFSIDLFERHCLVSGPYRSGRSNALCTVAAQAQRLGLFEEIHVLAPRKSPLLDLDRWDTAARGGDACTEAAKRLAERLDSIGDTPTPRILLVIDDAGELQDAASWSALERLVRLGRDRGVRIVAAAETAAARMISNLWIRELRKDGQGLLLMPESQADGDVLGVNLPRRQSTVMVTGRGYLAARGSVVLVQVPLVLKTDPVGPPREADGLRALR